MYVKALKGPIQLVASDAAAKLVAFALTGLMARQLGLEALAFVALAQGMVGYATVISDGGLNSHAVRRIAKGERRQIVIFETVTTQFTLAILGCSVAICWMVVVTPSALPYAIGLLGVPLFTALAVPYILQLESKWSALSLTRVASAVSTAGAGILLIFCFRAEASAVTWAYSVGALSLAIGVNWVADVDYKIFARRPHWRRMRDLVFQTKWLGLAALTVQVLATVPLMISAAWGSSEDFEAAGVASRLWFIAMAPPAMATAVLLPRFARRQRTATTAVVAGSALSVFGLFVLGWLALLGSETLETIFGSRAESLAHQVVTFFLASPIYGLIAVLTPLLISRGLYGAVLGANLGGIAVAVCSFLALRSRSELAVGISWTGGMATVLVVLTLAAAWSLVVKRGDREGVLTAG